MGGKERTSAGRETEMEERNGQEDHNKGAEEGKKEKEIWGLGKLTGRLGKKRGGWNSSASHPPSPPHIFLFLTEFRRTRERERPADRTRNAEGKHDGFAHKYLKERKTQILTR